MPPADLEFAVTWDYRCPFARNAHEHVAAGLRSGAPWAVRFVPFSLSQMHVEEGKPDVWDAPESDSGLLALQVGVAARELVPERFLDVHEALFALRHDHGGHLRDEAALRAAVDGVGVDTGAIFDHVASGAALETVHKEHVAAETEHGVWGVPTFIAGSRAAFVRLMDRPGGDADHAIRSVERVVDLLSGWPELNELKHTTLDR